MGIITKYYSAVITSSAKVHNILVRRKMNSRRIADASAIAVLATMAMKWVTLRGLALIVSGGFTGFDLMAKGFSLLLITPIAAIICLLILVHSETDQQSYINNRKTFSIIRILCAIIGAIPVIVIIYSVLSYDISKESNYFAVLIMSLMPPELNEGIYLNLISFIVIGVEAFIDLKRESV